MLPDAPVTFSITTGCPSDDRMPSEMRRALVSIAPPAGTGTTMVIGRDGKVCALANREAAGAMAAPAVKRKNLRRASFIAFLLERDDCSSNRHPALACFVAHDLIRKPVSTFRDHALGCSRRWKRGHRSGHGGPRTKLPETGRRGSVHLDALGLDHLGPFVSFLSDVLCEPVRSQRHRLDAQLRESLLYHGIGECLTHCIAELL